MSELINTNPPYNFIEGACLLIDKPLHFTSFDVVNKVRTALKKKFNIKNIKVGHAGTLDPLATGLLIVCTGKFTKRIDELMGQEKGYTGTLRLGETTPSVDGEFPVDNTFPTAHITSESLQASTAQFIGDIMQIPPIFSAIKKDGKKAYEAARAGEEIELAARPVNIREFELTRIDMPEVDFAVSCSKGTYIRSLVRDFGLANGSGAWMSALRRTRIGDYTIEQAWQLDDLIERINKM